jgi:arylsulfatase A-like enzyme
VRSRRFHFTAGYWPVAAAVAGLLCIASIAGCGRGDKPHNIVLITVDTLRPDHLGCYGYAKPTSPTIDDLAARSVVFTDAYSQAGWTLHSVATILTGRYPQEHGATDFHWSLDARLPTLSTILRSKGYDTAGYVSHVMLTPTYGFGDGFSHYDFSVLDIGHPHDVSTSKELTDLALQGLRRMKEPYFLWVHYFDPHFAYLSHAGFESFGSDDLGRYDSEIAFTDYHIARLLRNIDTKNTVVVFTADHGEEFGEHGGQYHYTFYDEVMRVPLMIEAPGLAPGTDRTQAEQIDLLPTILDLLGVESPADLPGRDLLSGEPDDTPTFIERDRPPPWRQRGVIKGNQKLFVVEMQDTNSIPVASRGTEVPVRNVHLGIFRYDLKADPKERTNLYTPTDSTSLDLLGCVAGHFSVTTPRENPVELDPDLLKKLKSLGYVR